MITEIRIKNKNNLPCSWWDKSPALMKKRVIKFKPGLNIVWAPNGAGKTTLLRTIARLMQCEQSGKQVVTENSLRDLFGMRKTVEPGAVIKHNGAGVLYNNPDDTVGLSCGSFDEDFMMAGVQNLMAKMSSGTKAQDGFVKCLTSLRDGDFKLEYKITKNNVNSVWQERIEIVEKILEGDKSVQGPATLLVDEVDKSVDLIRQKQIWDLLVNYSGHFQIIAVSHNPLALNIKGANYIDLEKGYLKECRELFTNVFAAG